MTEAQKKIREYLANIGSRGGRMSRRELTKSHARQMVAIREIRIGLRRFGSRPLPQDRHLISDLRCAVDRAMSGRRG
jgi:hypothetical protein